MSTIVELITALVISFFGITVEEPATAITEVFLFVCCDMKQEPSSDMLLIKNISSIKIKHKKTKNTLL